MAVPYYIAPTVSLKWDDFEADVEQVRQIRDSLGQQRDIKPAWTTWIAYAAWSDAADRSADRLRELRISQAILQMPVQICLDSWWANTPAGADGQGGFWSDVKYQQVVFNVTRIGWSFRFPIAVRLVIASATAIRPDAGPSISASGVRSPIAIASPNAVEIHAA